MKLTLVASFFAIALVASLPSAHAQDDDKPFAEARIILQLSDADPAKQSMVLDVANNLIKHYGDPESVSLRVMAFGPGIQLYATDNALRPRVESLMVSGVQFVVCDNTLDTLERVKGTRPSVIDGVYHVQTGVAYIAEQVSRDWILVRP